MNSIVLNNIPGVKVGGAMEPAGRLWPNGEFSIGYAPAGGAERRLSPKEYADRLTPPLGSSIDSNSHRYPDEGAVRRGVNGLTSHGKKVLRNSIWRIQRLHGRSRMAFVTLTLPDITFEQSWGISTDWSRVVRVFFQKLGRYFERLGLPTCYAACTEMQTERLGDDGHPALHLHFVCVTKRRGEKGYAITPGEIRWLWASVIGPMVPDVEFWGAVENVVALKGDASRYMSKYLSKGTASVEPPRSDETGWSLPTAWYSVRANLRRWVLDNIRSHPRLMEIMERACLDGAMFQGCEYYFSGEIEAMRGTGPHYFVGKLKGPDMEEIIEIWAAEVLGRVNCCLN